MLSRKYHVKLSKFCSWIDKDIVYMLVGRVHDTQMIEIGEVTSKFHHQVLIYPLTHSEAIVIRDYLIKEYIDSQILIELSGVHFDQNQEEVARLARSSGYKLNTNKLYISGIPDSLEDEDLFKIFSQFGPVKNAYVCRKHHKGTYLYGFVLFFDQNAVKEALDEQKKIGKLLVKNKWARIKAIANEERNSIHYNKSIASTNKLIINLEQSKILRQGNIPSMVLTGSGSPQLDTLNSGVQNYNHNYARNLQNCCPPNLALASHYFRLSEVDLHPFRVNRILNNLYFLHESRADLLRIRKSRKTARLTNPK